MLYASLQGTSLTSGIEDRARINDMKGLKNELIYLQCFNLEGSVKTVCVTQFYLHSQERCTMPPDNAFIIQPWLELLMALDA